MEKNRPKLVLFLVTGISALLAVVLVFFYVEGRIGAERARLKESQNNASQPQTREVVVAARPIADGQKITREDLRVVRVNQDALEPNAEFPTVEQLVGQVAHQPIFSGEWLMIAKLGGNPADGSTISAMLEPGQRAIRVKVDSANGLLGLIAPTDRVDVVTVFPSSQTGEVASRIVLQNIPVLAVGNRRKDSAESTTGDANNKASQEDSRESSITLAVSGQEAGMLALAMNSGKIHLLLRNSTDQQLSANTLIRVSSLAGNTLQTQGGGQQVTVIQGTKITTEVVQ